MTSLLFLSFAIVYRYRGCTVLDKSGRGRSTTLTFALLALAADWHGVRGRSEERGWCKAYFSPQLQFGFPQLLLLLTGVAWV